MKYTQQPIPFFRSAMAGLTLLVAVILLWEGLGSLGLYDTALIPKPSSVAIAIGQLAGSGLLFSDVLHSLRRVIGGFLVGASVGFMLGLLTGLWPRLRSLVEPIIQIARPVPAVALVPLAIMWFGVGEASKLFVISWAAFFPVWINTYLGVQRVPLEYWWTAAVLGADRKRTIGEIVVPSSLPYVQAGLRIAIGLAFTATVVAEMSGASSGLGYRIIASHLIFRVDRMIAAILMIGALGATIDWAFTLLTRRFFPWLESVRIPSR